MHGARSVSPVHCFKPVVTLRAKTPPGTGKTESQVEDSESNQKRAGVAKVGDSRKTQDYSDATRFSDYSWEKEQLLEQQKIPVGGRLRFFWKEWRSYWAVEENCEMA